MECFRLFLFSFGSSLLSTRFLRSFRCSLLFAIKYPHLPSKRKNISSLLFHKNCDKISFVGGISRPFFISLNIFLIIMALFCNLSPPQPFSAVYFPHSIISRIRPAALASFFLIPSIFCASTRRRHPHFCMFDPPFSSHFPPLINLFVCFSRNRFFLSLSLHTWPAAITCPPSLLLHPLFLRSWSAAIACPLRVPILYPFFYAVNHHNRLPSPYLMLISFFTHLTRRTHLYFLIFLFLCNKPAYPSHFSLAFLFWLC